MDYYTQQSILSIIAHLFFIGISFYALQAVQIEKIIRKNRVFQAQLLFILLSVFIGSIVANFFLSFSGWSQSIVTLF